MEPGQLEALDEPSRRFAERLFARFPQWRSLASAESRAPPGRFRGDEGGLRVDVPSPAGDPERTLTFFVAEGDPSLGFGDWHTHAGLFTDEDELLSFAEDVVADRQLFLVIGSAWMVLEGPIEDAVDDALTMQDAPDEVRVVSWSGKRDRTVRLADRRG